MSDHPVPVTLTFKNFKSVYMELLIWKGVVQFRFRNKKYIEIFNKSGKHFIFVSKGIDIRVKHNKNIEALYGVMQKWRHHKISFFWLPPTPPPPPSLPLFATSISNPFSPCHRPKSVISRKTTHGSVF